MGLCKSFATDFLENSETVSKVEQIALISKTADYFADNKEFDVDKFAKEVYKDAQLIEAFNEYKHKYELDTGMAIQSNFNISEQALKKQIKTFKKNILKLSSNFRILIDSNNDFIKKGFDKELGLNYYTLYYKEEL